MFGIPDCTCGDECTPASIENGLSILCCDSSINGDREGRMKCVNPTNFCENWFAEKRFPRSTGFDSHDEHAIK